MIHSPGAGMKFYPAETSYFHFITLKIHRTSRFPHEQELNWTLPRGRPKLQHHGRILVHALCKDQDGCRYLQRSRISLKKLKDHIPSQVYMIWLGTKQLFIELMADSFGNHVSRRILRDTTYVANNITCIWPIPGFPIKWSTDRP